MLVTPSGMVIEAKEEQSENKLLLVDALRHRFKYGSDLCFYAHNWFSIPKVTEMFTEEFQPF